MKAKIGDIIVITNGARTNLLEHDGCRVTVVKVDDSKVWCKANDLIPNWPHDDILPNFYIRHDCYELAEVVNSPLWKALQ